MCGIAGIIGLNDKKIIRLQAKINLMNDEQKHRGPDDKGIWINKNRTVGLGHRRLSIVDLSILGHQPMSNEDGSIWIAFNGEIYNHLDIRKELIKKGHKYKSKSDTETIIHAYEEWGVKCLQKFRGMFAFAIWDNNKKQLFFARDRIGIKPLYYTFHQNAFYFASEIKAILSNSEIPRSMDEESFYHYLTFFVAPAPKTLFKDIYKMEPGHYAILTNKGKLIIEEYWDAISQIDNSKTEKEWKEEILKGLKESIKLRMMSDVPFGAYLSGGIDSSAITILMNELMDRPIDTFTVGFKKDQEFNELEYAKQVCKKYGANYHEILIDKKDLKTNFNKMIYHQDEPIADWVCFPLYYVSKLIRDNGVIVAQVGEGSDELFCGYDGYILFINNYKYYQFIKALPKSIKFLLMKFTNYLFWLKPLPFIPETFRKAYYNEEFFWGGAIAFNEWEKNKLLTKKILNKYNSHTIIKKIYNKFDSKSSNRSILDRMTYIELKNRLAELLLMRVDKISMSVSVEARVPFLDHEFVEKMLSIPKNIKLSKGSKTILKEALNGVIPHDIIYRKKKGFGAPISKWMKNKIISDFIMDTILKSDLMSQGLLKEKYVKWMFSQHQNNKTDYGVQLWILANVCGWYDYWIKK